MSVASPRGGEPVAEKRFLNHVLSQTSAGEGLNEGNRAMYEHQLKELEVPLESHPSCIEMLLHVTGIVRRCCVDFAVRVHARLFSPPRWVHRNCTYGPFVRHGRRWRSRCRMRDDDARNASCCPKPRRRNK